MFFDIGDSNHKPVSEGGPKGSLGCRSFDQGSPLKDSNHKPVSEGGPKGSLGCRSFDRGAPLPPLPQRVPTLPLPPRPKFHLPGGRRHALMLQGFVMKPRTEKRFDRGPERDHGSSGRGSPGTGYWQSHRPRKEPKAARCAERTLTPVGVETKRDKNVSFHNKRERFRLFWTRSQLFPPTPPTKLPSEPPTALPLRGQIRLLSPTLALSPPAPTELPTELPTEPAYRVADRAAIHFAVPRVFP